MGYALVQRDIRVILDSFNVVLVLYRKHGKNYATIELGCSSILWAVQKCYYYLRGLKGFKIITDHRPLVGVFDKPLSVLTNNRLQRIRENLVTYKFVVEWSASKTHFIADALSRAPFFPGDEELDMEVCKAIDTEDPALRLVTDNIDQEYRDLCHHTQSARPLPSRLDSYSGLCGGLRVEDGILLHGTRLVIPIPARTRILDLLPASHSGMNKTSSSARQIFV